MVEERYKRAYTEVLEVLNNLSEEEYKKIPKDKIEYYKENRDRNYKFKIDLSVPIEEMNLSKEANAILVSLFLDYFVTTRQKEGLEEMLYKNEE